MNRAEPEFVPMTAFDLDWVVRHEAELHAFPWTRANFVDSLAAGYTCRIMRLGDDSAAYAVMLCVLDEAHLLNISVARARQRRGAGSLLLRHLFDEARLAGATQLFLEVRPSNAPALALYGKHGFETVGRRKRYYPAHGGDREDALVMRCEL